MTRKGRMWVGVTLLVVIALNYAILGFPLMRRAASVQDKYKAILVKEAKSASIFRNSENEYMLEIFRKEKADADRKMLVLNCAAASLAIFIASWTVFGLLFHRGK